MTARPIFFEVPPSVPARACTACGVKIYFVTTRTGARMPVTCDVVGGSHPVGGNPGRGLSHYIDCPRANTFRRR